MLVDLEKYEKHQIDYRQYFFQDHILFLDFVLSKDELDQQVANNNYFDRKDDQFDRPDHCFILDDSEIVA